MKELEQAQIEELSNQLIGHIQKAKEANPLLSGKTDKEISNLILEECNRVIDETDKLNYNMIYNKLVAEKKTGRILSVDDITSEILEELIYNGNFLIRDIADLFNTEAKTISALKKQYGLSDRAMVYKEFTKNLAIAAENICNTKEINNNNEDGAAND